MALLKSSWLPNCAMKRVICHWTAGQHQASSLDKEHYHFLVESDGKVIKGNRSIADNVSTTDGVYAAHTLNCNTGSIGVAVCCMVEAVERPFKAGKCPMTQEQWEAMAEVVAELCRFYRISVTPQTGLGHGEVEIRLAIKQKGKWDPMALPWDVGLSKTEVGNAFRALVQSHLDGPLPAEATQFVNVSLKGKEVGRVAMTNGGAWVPAKAVAELFNWTTDEAEGEIRFKGARSPKHAIAVVEMDGAQCIDAEQLATRMGYSLEWDQRSRKVVIT